MQTALHIAALVGELQRDIIDASVSSTEFYKKQRAAYFFFRRPRSHLALGFVYHPAGWGCFVAPASKIRLETAEKPWPVFGLDGAVVVGVEQFGLDRIFRIDVTLEGRRLAVVFEAVGPNGNLWLLDDEGGRRATLRKREFDPGTPYDVPAVPPGRLNPLEITGQLLRSAAGRAAAGQSPVAFTEKRIASFNQTMAKEALKRSDITAGSLGDVSPDEFDNLARTVRQLARTFMTARDGYLYGVNERLEAYPFKLSFVEQTPEKFRTLSLAILNMTVQRQSVAGAEVEKKAVLSAVERAIGKLERRLEKLEHDINRASDYEQDRVIGELLQVNRQQLRKGMTTIALDDVFVDPPSRVEIALNPAQSPGGNIEAYFKKYRKGREGLELLVRRREISGDELEQLQVIGADLERDFEAARERYQSEISGLLPGVARKTPLRPRLPYREHTLSTGLRILVGREGTDNDRTTFEFAKPYELWFHTQQCPGSHVVMKFPNKSFDPSRREIEEAAAAAAFYSKAKNDSLVPVIYTQRRFVRKPRGVKPGLVTVEREKSIMVAPRKPD
ncbi:MAG TPA: NFACT RNA binding domain-containing protein [Acidobacteriota bacterium]|nr:NFACT RNA binding domain-containing protein [Acidobacteriota bacterium]